MPTSPSSEAMPKFITRTRLPTNFCIAFQTSTYQKRSVPAPTTAAIVVPTRLGLPGFLFVARAQRVLPLGVLWIRILCIWNAGGSERSYQHACARMAERPITPPTIQYQNVSFALDACIVAHAIFKNTLLHQTKCEENKDST